uniref:Uncharacterized protein n=1 Tax=Ixodes ricinus TaxID=34613 RepID=A0A6B0UWK3_IXORI
MFYSLPKLCFGSFLATPRTAQHVFDTLNQERPDDYVGPDTGRAPLFPASGLDCVSKNLQCCSSSGCYLAAVPKLIGITRYWLQALHRVVPPAPLIYCLMCSVIRVLVFALGTIVHSSQFFFFFFTLRAFRFSDENNLWRGGAGGTGGGHRTPGTAG